MPPFNHPPLILIADDHRHTREMYAQYLTFVGFVVTEAEDGTDALRHCRLQTPDLIVMDLAMPDMDGWSAIQLLKQDAALKHIPILVLTGDPLAEDEKLARRYGCDDFCRKPCSPPELHERITRLLTIARLTR